MWEDFGKLRIEIKNTQTETLKRSTNLRAMQYRFFSLVFSSTLRQVARENWSPPTPSQFYWGRHLDPWLQWHLSIKRLQYIYIYVIIRKAKIYNIKGNWERDCVIKDKWYKRCLPSIWMSSSDLTLLLASCSLDEPRLEQIASISSMNMVLGA